MKIVTGIISKWNDDKGFGFITPKSGDKPIFFHINDYSFRHKRPFKNLEVQYATSTDNKGRRCGIDVAPLKGHKNNGRVLKQKMFALVLVSAFSFVLYFLLKSRFISIELIYLYSVTSIIAFLMYAKDKNAAQKGKWRTSEGTLHALALLGGWPGAKIAQSFLRHKSKKLSFRVTYWVTVIANCSAAYWFSTPKGSLWLKNILRSIDFG